MRLTADSDADHERLLRKYAADARATSEHFAWLEEMSPRLYLASDAGLAVVYYGNHHYTRRNAPESWLIREVARVGTVEALVRTRTGANNAEITKHYAGVMDSERMWRTDFGSNGSSHYFEGDEGAEHKVRIEFASGAVQHYEGGRGAERLVRSTHAIAGSGVPKAR